MKASNVFNRQDGSVVTLVAEDFRCPFRVDPSQYDVGYYALVDTKTNPRRVVQQGNLMSVVSAAEVIKTGLKLRASW